MRPYGKLRFTYIKCQRCGEIKPIKEPVGVEFPPEDGRPRPEIWCKICFAEMLLE